MLNASLDICSMHLNFTALWAVSEDDKLGIFFLCFREKGF